MKLYEIALSKGQWVYSLLLSFIALSVSVCLCSRLSSFLSVCLSLCSLASPDINLSLFLLCLVLSCLL